MSQSKTTVSVTLPNGNTVTKTSTRAYTHAVLSGVTEATLGVFGWASSERSAKSVQSESRRVGYPVSKIVPVDAVKEA